MIGSAVGPAPFPALVRDLQRVIGDEAREQALAAEGAPAGAGDRLRRRRLQRDRHLHPLRRRRRGRADRRRGGRRGARHAAATAPRSAPGSTGVLHGSLSSVIADEEGQILEAHSISAGLDYPGVGPEHAHLRDTGRASYTSVTDDAGAGRLRRALRAWRGSSRRSSPRTRSPGCWRTGAATDSTSSVCRAAATRTSPRCCADTGARVARREARGMPGCSSRGGSADRRRLRGGEGRRPGGADALHDGRLSRSRDVARRRRRLCRRRGRPDRARRSLLGPARRRADDPCGGDGGARGRRQRRSRARDLRGGRRADARSC